MVAARSGMADRDAVDRELRALWLQNLETSPTDFLRVKFATQSARAEAATSEDGR